MIILLYVILKIRTIVLKTAILWAIEEKQSARHKLNRKS